MVRALADGQAEVPFWARRRQIPARQFRAAEQGRLEWRRQARGEPPLRTLACDPPPQEASTGRRHSTCQWPLWGDERPGEPVFCGAPVREGCSYCAAHARRAFTPARD
ncbi:MAG: hypothetical protein DI532_22430 [Azospirillum brasilense]|nr:MAG: hypothetical protein DI532_22430 [Azospirillum brasilense]